MSPQTAGVSLFTTWSLLEQAYGLFYRNLDRRRTQADLSQTQASVLLSLHAAGQPLSLARIGSLSVVQASSVTALVDRLETRGLVRRVRTAGDRRVIHLELTAEGEALCARLYPAQLAALTESFAVLRVHELQALTKALRTLRNHGADLLHLSRRLFDEAAAEPDVPRGERRRPTD